MKTLNRTLTPALLAASLALAALFVPASSAEAGPRVRVVVNARPVARVVVAPRPAAKVVVVAPAAKAERCWVPGHWERVSPRRSVWIAGHWTVR